MNNGLPRRWLLLIVADDAYDTIAYWIAYDDNKYNTIQQCHDISLKYRSLLLIDDNY